MASSSAAANGPHLVSPPAIWRDDEGIRGEALSLSLSGQEISFICYLLGSGGSAFWLLPRTLLPEMTSAMGRKKEGPEGRREGGKGKDGRKSEDREGESQSQRGLFPYRRPFLWRSLRLPLRSLHCFSPEQKRRPSQVLCVANA